MKKLIATIAALSVLTAGAGSFAHAEAPASLVYGTMQIPYADFYAAEGALNVDAVSSATNSKWNSENFTTGAYVQPHTEDAGGDILGVVYPVAIEESVLASLGENDYDFTPLSEVPEAYKTVTMTDGVLRFSAVTGESHALDAAAVLKTATNWGDYEIDIDAIHNQNGTSDIGTIYGALLQCSDGNTYAMRHLENIWLDELSWSSGVRTVEPHGNVMNSEMYADIMGKTITGITYITETGYYTIETDLYVPVKFIGGIAAADAPAGTGSTEVTFDSVPGDYAVSASVAGMDAVLTGTTLTYTDALPGAYTLTVSDSAGVYADITAGFVLSTEELPVVFDTAACALTAAQESDAPAAAAFLANITSVTVNDTAYAASGRGAVAIVDRTGAIDPEAAVVTGRGADAVSTPVFTAGETYTVTVTASGFPTLTFEMTAE